MDKGHGEPGLECGSIEKAPDQSEHLDMSLPKHGQHPYPQNYKIQVKRKTKPNKCTDILCPKTVTVY